MTVLSKKTASDTAILKLYSPSFIIDYPAVQHPEIIPPDVLRAMEGSWKRQHFAENEVVFSLLKDVFVVEEGLVFDLNGDLFKESTTQHSAAEVVRGHAAVQNAIQSGDFHSISGTALLCKKRGVKNFGHWMMEMLPKAFLAKTHLQLENLRYLVPKTSSALERVVTDSLGMLAIENSSLHFADEAPLFVRQLIMVEGLTYHGVFMSPITLDCMQHISRQFKAEQHDRLFVTRKTATSRRFVNEAEVEQQAVKSGYKLVDPGTMSLAEQITTFKGAKKIIGVMGAEMTNIAFAPRFAEVVNIAPANMPDTFFWFIAGLRGQTYSELRLPQTGPVNGVAPWDTDLAITEHDLQSLFSQ